VAEVFWAGVCLFLIGSTIICAWDFYLRVLWHYQVGWTNSGDTWGWRWINWHITTAIFFLFFHGFIRRVAKQSEKKNGVGDAD